MVAKAILERDMWLLRWVVVLTFNMPLSVVRLLARN
jgi:hypothetical protein